MGVESLYLETSSLLKVLFREEGYEKIASVIENSRVILTSQVTLIEAQRAISRALAAGALKASAAKQLEGVLESHALGWNILGIIEPIQRRAGQQFPSEPVRTLDAIHLATALEFLTVYPELVVLSHDERVQSNLEPLGLRAVGA